jgi:hypothetical protein
MLLIAEIILVITAWRKGWRWRALLPVVIAFGVAVLMGVAVGAGGGSIDSASPLFTLVDIGLVITLIAMVRRAPAAVQPARAPVVIPASDPVAGMSRG